MMKSTGSQSQIWNNGIKSLFLLAMFPVFVGLIVYAGLIVQLGLSGMPVTEALVAGFYALPPTIPYVFVGVAVWFVIAFLLNVQMINMAMGAKSVSRKQEPELYNLLENLCIAKGMPMPRLSIIETDAMNAFASGMTKRQYMVAVTRGLMRTLSKDELEGVLAHELAHIRHGDVRLMVIASVFVGIFTLILELMFRNGDIFLRAFTVSSTSKKSGNDKGGGAAAVLILVLIALAILIVTRILSVMTQLALSRTREYMADLEAVRMTKNPDAMVSALLKISGRSDVQGVPNEVRGMFFDNARSFAGNLFSTHPTIDQRIKSLVSYAGAKVLSPSSQRRQGPWA